MPGRITIERADSHRDLVPGWTVQLDAMPHSPLASSGSTGEVAFSAPTTSQTIRTMYNPAVFEYFYPQFLDEVPIPATIPLPPPVHPPSGTGWGENTWGGGVWGGTQGGANQPPIASFTVTPTRLAVSLDASGSTDRDGRVVSYTWDFGDGSTGSGVQTQHTYPADGTYTIQLMVLDNLGAAGRATAPVSVTAAGTNQPPIPSFTVTPNALAVTVNGSASHDPDGSIVSWAWTFGDGAIGTGVTATHTYAAAGTYAIGLRVTDNGGLQGQTSTTVTLSTTSTGGWGAEAWGTDPWGE